MKPWTILVVNKTQADRIKAWYLEALNDPSLTAQGRLMLWAEAAPFLQAANTLN